MKPPQKLYSTYSLNEMMINFFDILHVGVEL